MNSPVKNLVIVGGGTAGWLTAAIIAAEHNAKTHCGICLTVIESPDIPTIGVGEGTWPTMRATLQMIGISEQQFIACCDASFKQGSKFSGWVSGNQDDHYYHPFIAPHGFAQSDLVAYWQQHFPDKPFADILSFQPHLCEQGLAPKQLQTPQYAAVANYGYHLNAGKFASLLKQHCIEKLGVHYLSDNVVSVNGEKDSPIRSLRTNQNGEVFADLFIDCSGSHSILLGEHYQIPIINRKNELFNDRALAVQVPYGANQQEILSHTLSTAHDAGWFWDISLPSRRGVGCVYASEFCSDEAAKTMLLDYLSQSLSDTCLTGLTIKKLTFEPGHRQKFWHHNCVAVGMSAGFIEPLEASALAMVELSAKMIAKELPATSTIMHISSARFNQRFSYRWQRIIEFLKLHYILSKRESAYWKAHREIKSIPENLTSLLSLWRYQEPTYNDFTQIEEIFPAASYQYILYGMGFITEPRKTSRRYMNEHMSVNNIKECQQLKDKYASGLPSNRALIEYMTNTYYKNQRQS